MRLRIARFEDLAADPAAIHHPAPPPGPERLVFNDFTVAPTQGDWLELRDAAIVPAGGVAWNGWWIAHDVEYVPPDWPTRDWRPGDLHAETGEIDIDEARLAPDRVIDAPALFCDTRLAVDNFGHFVHDLLPYGLLFRQLRQTIPDLLPLMGEMHWQSQRRLVGAVFGRDYAACAITGARTLARRMVLARRQSSLEGPVWTTSFAGLRAARTAARAAFGLAPPAHAPQAGMGAGTKVYLHREQDVPRLAAYNMLHGRDFSNMTDLAGMLLARGFVAIEPGRAPIDVVAGILAQASVVVGVHGANMGNILFCPPGARVLELRAYEGNWRDYEMMAGVLGLDFAAIPQPAAEEGARPEIDVDALAGLLQDG